MMVLDTRDIPSEYFEDESLVALPTPTICRERLWATWLCGRCRREQQPQTARYYTPNVIDHEGDQVGLCPHCAEVAEVAS